MADMPERKAATAHAPFSQGRMDFTWSRNQWQAPRKEGQGLLGGNPYKRPGLHQVPDWGRNQPFIRSLMQDGPSSSNQAAFRAFLASRPDLEIEVGVGRGDFLLARARQRPAYGFVGFEVKTGAAIKLVQRVAKAELANTWICDDDARFGLPHLFANRQAAALHVLFPDPWWKPSHVHRRLFTPAFVALLGQCIRPGGLLHVRSDVAELVDSARFLVADTALFLPPDDKLQRLLEPYQPTHREQWCLRHGFRVHTLMCIRTPADGK